MHPELNYTIAKLHHADLIRTAEQRRLGAELSATRSSRRALAALLRVRPRIVSGAHVDVLKRVHVDEPTISQPQLWDH